MLKKKIEKLATQENAFPQKFKMAVNSQIILTCDVTWHFQDCFLIAYTEEQQNQAITPARDHINHLNFNFAPKYSPQPPASPNHN